MSTYKSPLDDTTKEALQSIANSKVLFAHHSLGDNILEGLEGILDEAGLNPEKLIKAYDSSSPILSDRVLLHARPGKNKAPNSKVDGFAEVLRQLDGFSPQVAAMKYCFVDFNPHTEVNQVFDYYKEGIELLKQKRPEIVFAHVTVPLSVKRTSIKQRVNKFLGRMVWNEESNLKRAEFNKRLTETFKDQPIFDLARVESTRPDGSREQHTYKNKGYYSLVPDYTDDGSHLNANGKRIVAIQLAQFLGEILKTEVSSE